MQSGKTKSWWTTTIAVTMYRPRASSKVTYIIYNFIYIIFVKLLHRSYMQQLMKQTFLGNNIFLRIILFRVLGSKTICETLFTWFNCAKKLFNIGFFFHLQSQTVYQRITSKSTLAIIRWSAVFSISYCLSRFHRFLWTTTAWTNICVAWLKANEEWMGFV